MEILKSLDSAPFINSYDVIDYKTFGLGFYIKIKVILKDKSELHIKEYFNINERNYSYHWQSEQGTTIIRGDNAPHHRNITTYPHHRRESNSVVASNEITIAEILSHIEKRI